MSGLKRLFCEHPESVNETYFEHLIFAGGFGIRMLVAGLACLVHGLLPFLFKRTGSQIICELHERLSSHGRPTTSTTLDKDQVTQS